MSLPSTAYVWAVSGMLYVTAWLPVAIPWLSDAVPPDSPALLAVIAACEPGVLKKMYRVLGGGFWVFQPPVPVTFMPPLAITLGRAFSAVERVLALAL